jgi:hypothetical protein
LGGSEGEKTLSGMIIKEYTVAVCSDADHTLRMSAFGGKADIIYGVPKGPLLATSGHLVIKKLRREPSSLGGGMEI